MPGKRAWEKERTPLAGDFARTGITFSRFRRKIRARLPSFMPLTYRSRTGKTYFLHAGPRRGGGTQHFFSTKSAGTLAEQLPEGFELYETVNGQVYLRRQQAKQIENAERDYIVDLLAKPRPGHRYKVEVQGKILTVHESARDPGWLDRFPLPLHPQKQEEINERFAHYLPVLRFVLVDGERRLFAPERFCFRGSIDDWISIGEPNSIKKLSSKYLKHLGQDSIYDLH